MCKVLNARQVGKRPMPDRIYVGRPSKWGNPFVIGRDGLRDEVIANYRAWIVRQPALMAALHELRSKDLGTAVRIRTSPRGTFSAVSLCTANRHEFT
jgi:Domain of unknown function (DUF4326)